MTHELLTRLIGSVWQRRGKRDSASQDLPLEVARRHVWLGERHVTRQAQIFEELLAAGMDVERAEALLATYLEFLRVAREHLKSEEMKAAARRG